MEQECSNKVSDSVCIIGGGASGYFCAYLLIKNGIQVTIFDKGEPLRTLLPTGGGRCNLAHAEYDFKELAKNYPRGEKFLYSIFSKFSTYDTLNEFNNIGIETYTQDDGRIFPVSNSAKDVRGKLLQASKDAKFLKEEVKEIVPLKSGYTIITNKASYYFNTVIISTGGHTGYNILKNLDISIIPQKPSLVGLKTNDTNKNLSGIVVKNCICENQTGDILFTHYGLSGPLIYKISSLKAFNKFPYELDMNLCDSIVNLQESLNKNPHKTIKNILTDYIPQKLGMYILDGLGINTELHAHSINGKTRDMIIDKISRFNIIVSGTDKGEETVMAGGINLDEVIPQTMEIKKYPNLYAIGEILNIDGFCGGFNLQNAWSTAYVAADSITQNN